LKSPHPVLPLFIFDQNSLSKLEEKEDRRVHFIHQALEHLKFQFEKAGSGLIVYHSTPQETFKDLLSKFRIKSVYTNHDYEPDAIKRDEDIKDQLLKSGVEFHSFKDQVIYEKDDILKPDGKPYTIFTPFSRRWKDRYYQNNHSSHPSEMLLTHLYPSNSFHFPSLNEIGFKKTDVKFNVPELNHEIVKHYHETRNIPSIEGTTMMGIHLRFGTISIRKLAKIANELNEQWLNELIWREFFMTILFHFPYVQKKSFKPKYDHIQWRNNEKEFELWCKGETGFPIIDAGMRELNETGFMHNRVRMIVASFLTKDLLIDWRWGEAYFAGKLLDYDLSANNGNWQWAAGCGCDAAPYFRIFNPTEQTRKFDPELKYIKKWIRNFDNYAITPIVDHDFARKRCLEVYKKALS
jgi:deoxyribodipyrimidine photo-lyase